MVSLKDWMRRELLSDADVADRIGDISAEHVRKIRFGARGASGRVSAAIFTLSGGAVRPPDLVPSKRKPTPAEARP